jgi:hypothetical protein
MKRRWRLSLGVGLAVVAIASIAVIPSVASADEEARRHDHAGHDNAAHGLRAELAKIRRATARFRRVENAIAAGYQLGWVNGSGVRIITGCVSHPTAGAMGYHYFNQALVDDLGVDPLRPEAMVYEPKRNGKLRLVAVEWVVPGPNTNPPGLIEAPSVLGIQMHILVPAVGFWLKHAWIWKHNASGMFADWNPNVTCTPEQQAPDDEDDEDEEDEDEEDDD